MNKKVKKTSAWYKWNWEAGIDSMPGPLRILKGPQSQQVWLSEHSHEKPIDNEAIGSSIVDIIWILY